MLSIVRQPDGHEFVVQADRLCIDSAGPGRYRFHDEAGTFMDVPAAKVEHVRLALTGAVTEGLAFRP